MLTWNQVRESKTVFFLSLFPRMLIVCHLYTGEWEHFLYVGKIALFGWLLHFGTCSCPLHCHVPFPQFAPLPLLVAKLTKSRILHSSVLNHGARNLRSPLCTSLLPTSPFFLLILSISSPPPSVFPETANSSRRSILASSWQRTCSITLSSRLGASPSAQNRSYLPSLRLPSWPTFGGSVASRGASMARSTTIGDLGGERSVVDFFFFFSREGKLMIFWSVSRGMFMICSIGLMLGGRIFSSPSPDLPQGNIKTKKHVVTNVSWICLVACSRSMFAISI